MVSTEIQPLILGKTAEDMWTILEKNFHDTTPMSHMEVITKAGKIQMSDYTDPALYCNKFQMALAKVTGMIPRKVGGDGVAKPNGIHNATAAEGILQAYMLMNVTDSYRPLVAQIQENWNHENTNLFEACRDIVRYGATITTTKALCTSKGKAPPGTCTNEEYIS